MKILHILRTYHPSSGGMHEVVKQISENLAKNGHNITIATTKLPEKSKENFENIKIIEFDISGDFSNGLKGEIDTYQKFLINSEFDIITCFAAQQATADALFPIIDKIKAKKVFVPTGFSAFYITKFKEYFEKMGEWMNKFDMNIFLSNDYRDINFAREKNVHNIRIIPNGASREEFSKEISTDIREKLNIPKNNFLILHVGSHTRQKGHKEAIEIFAKANINNSTFLIIGNDGLCLSSCQKQEAKLNKSQSFKIYGKKIITKHLNRDETIAAYKAANLFLFPSNIECSPVVLFECMAAKLPFLTTEAGNAKEIIEWSGGGQLLPTKKNIYLENYFIGKTKKVIKKLIGRIDNDYHFCKAKINESAIILENLFNNKEKLNQLGESGHKAWEERFNWEKISKEYENLYFELLKK